MAGYVYGVRGTGYGVRGLANMLRYSFVEDAFLSLYTGLAMLRQAKPAH